MTEQIDNSGNADGAEKAQDGMSEAVKRAIMRHKFIRAVIGAATMGGMAIYLTHLAIWLSTIHGNLLAGWIIPLIMAGPAGAMAGLTIMLSQTRSWGGTASLFMVGLLVVIQFVAGTVGAALLLSSWQATAPQSMLVQLLPLLAGIALAAPTSLATIIIIGHRPDESGAKSPPRIA
jgi:hypothetical protein